MCTKLTGDICGDYGLKLKVDEEKVNICKTNVTTVLPIDEKGDVEYWYTQAFDHEVDCYLWCQTDKDFNSDVEQDFEASFLSNVVSFLKLQNCFRL